MNKLKLLFLATALGAAALWGAGACSTGAGDCPAASAVQPGGACSDNHLQCPYNLLTPSAACDGTSSTIATSCVCTDGTWSCPSPAACDAGPSDDGATSDDGASEASTPDASTPDAVSPPADTGAAVDAGKG